MLSLRPRLLACVAVFAAAISAARGAVTISDVTVTNVGTTTFTVVWRTSEESTPGLDVFSDAAGANAVTAGLSLDYYPIALGDPAVTNSAKDRAGRVALELLAAQQCVVSIRVSGLTPGTTYYVRPRSFDANGADNGVSSSLTTATTAQTNSLVRDVRVLRIHVPTFVAKGMILLIQGPSGTTPLSTIVGDSDASDVAYVSTAWIIDTATGTNALFTTTQSFVIRALGKDAPAGTFTQTVDFTPDFVVASPLSVEANIASPAPFITQQPQNAAVVVGGTGTFTVAVSGTPAPTLQWQRLPAGGGTWANVTDGTTYSGTTTTTLSVANAQLAMTGDQFRVIATNGVSPDATSAPATLTVSASAVAPAITTSPTSTAVVAGTNASFTVVATGTPTPTYRWQRKPAGGSTWADVVEGGTYSGSSSATLTISGTTTAMTGDQFRVIVSNSIAPDATSDAATLTVSVGAIAPAITTQPIAKTIGVGANATFTVAASGTPTPTYHWQIELAGSGSWIDLTETANYAGVATATLTVKSATAAMSGDQFRAIASNGTAPDATSNAVALTVQALPTITGQPASVSVGATGNASFTVAAKGTGTLTYQWQRLPVGTSNWQDLTASATYTNVTATTLNVMNVQSAMKGDQFRCVVTDSIGASTSDPATLTVTRTVATITLSNLQQVYDGTPRSAAATTSPSGLSVVFTYNGSADAPKFPGTYTVSASINDPNYAGTATGQLVISTTVLVRHASTFSGGVDGSVQQATGETVTVGGTMTGDFVVPGTPTVSGITGLQYGTGAIDPSTYTVTFSAGAAARSVVLRVDPVALPTIPTPPAPTGTRSVNLTAAGQSAGDFSTILNLTVSGTAGNVVVPPGTYGNLTANGSAVLVLGVAGATEPAVYNLQSLGVNTLRATAKLIVAGPVIINVAGTVALYGDTGAADHSEWLTINAAKGGVSTNLSATLWGHVIAPVSTVTLTGTSKIQGSIIADKVTASASTGIKQAP